MFSFKKLTRDRGQISKFINFAAKVLAGKRQKFIFAVIVLSLGLFIAEYILGKSAISIVFVLAVLSALFLYIGLREDLKDNLG